MGDETKHANEINEFAGWSDADIAKRVRGLMGVIRRVQNKDPNHLGMTCAAQFILVHDAHESNAGESRTVLHGASQRGEPIGDWEIIVRRRYGLMTRFRDAWEDLSERLFPRERLKIVRGQNDDGSPAGDVKWTAADGSDKTPELRQ